MAKNKSNEPSLEASIERLEEIVSQLEEGDLELEKSIELFVEGRKLGSDALRKLETLERRVQILLQTEKGGLEPVDFDEESEDELED